MGLEPPPTDHSPFRPARRSHRPAIQGAPRERRARRPRASSRVALSQPRPSRRLLCGAGPIAAAQPPRRAHPRAPSVPHARALPRAAEPWEIKERRAGAVLSPLPALRTSRFPLTPHASLRSAIRKGHFVAEGLNGGEHHCAPRPEPSTAPRRAERSATWLPARAIGSPPQVSPGELGAPQRGNASRRHGACNVR